MKFLLKCLIFLPFSLMAIEVLTPRIHLLEFPIEVEEKDQEMLAKWARAEMWEMVKKNRDNEKNKFQLLQAMSLYRFVAKPGDFYKDYFNVVTEKNEEFDKKSTNIGAIQASLNTLSKGTINNKRLAWYYFDYLATKFPQNKKYFNLKKSLPEGSWMTIIPGSEYRFSVSENLGNNKPDSIKTKISIASGYENKSRKIQKTSAKINGLVVITLRNGKTQGIATEITATPFLSSEAKGRVKIDQRVGLDMKRSVSSAMLALQKRYPFVYPNENILFSFASRESMKDGNSAGVAFSLLLYSLYEGIDIDSEIAVTGVIMPDCEIKAVGGVASKIRGAWKKNLKTVIIPKENKDAVSDLTLMYNVSIVWNMQIFSVDNFKDALAIAKKEKNQNIKNAIKKFSSVAKIMNKGNKEIIKNKSLILRSLDEVIKLAPNHESAKMLKNMLSGKRPKQLTLNGSVDFIFMIINRVLGISPELAYETSEEILSKNRLFLSKNIPRLAQEAHPFAREVVTYINSLIKFRNLLALNIHKDPQNVRTAHNLMNQEIKDMDKIRENLQKKWEALQKKFN